MGERSGVLDAMSRIIELGGAPERAERVASLRATFEARAGDYAPEDPWFEERSRAFWSDALTRQRFGRDVEAELSPDQARWLSSLERAHRGLFRSEGARIVDVWTGAELLVTVVDDATRAELAAASGQLFDGRVIGSDEPLALALVPGAVFHPRQATAAIEVVLAAARAAGLGTDETLDALLRMERTLRSLSRVKPAYAYRTEVLQRHPVSMRPSTKGFT
jgi:RecB family exonuclease